jgi:hypothetical protein
MNTILELQAAVNELIAPMLAKGLVQPDASAQLKANADGYIYLSWHLRKTSVGERWDSQNYKSDFVRVVDGDWSAAIAAANAHIAAMPSKEDRQRDEFLGLMAKTIEYGRQVGIDDEFVNPLSVISKKLSENALTHRPDAA